MLATKKMALVNLKMNQAPKGYIYKFEIMGLKVLWNASALAFLQISNSTAFCVAVKLTK